MIRVVGKEDNWKRPLQCTFGYFIRVLLMGGSEHAEDALRDGIPGLRLSFDVRFMRTVNVEKAFRFTET